MNTNEILNKIKLALQDVVEDVNLDEISEQTDLFNDLDLDSTSVIELLMALEDHFENLDLDPEELKIEDFQTVESLSNFIQIQLKEFSS